MAYFECATGISGDMTLAALIDAGADLQTIQAGIASLDLPEVQLECRQVMQHGFRALQVQVRHPEQHAHRHLSEIERLIDAASALTDSQKSLARQLFRTLAEAEARVHGAAIEQVHFHEVGAVDSLVDLIGVAIAVDLLQIDQIVCGPIPTGTGEVRIAHGICPLPAPGTAELLQGIPLRNLPIDAELTTPTGAAIARVLASRFGPLPDMTIDRIGCGAGTRTLPERANILRIFLGTGESQGRQQEICLLETNIDHVSAEVLGYTRQRLLQAGALDVYSVPIQMKKDRPGVLLSVLAMPQQQAMLEELLFRETGTLGIRRQQLQRTTRPRQSCVVQTEFGPVDGKISWFPAGDPEFSPEFECCARLAAQQDRPLREIFQAARRAFDRTSSAPQQ
jgi:uncharacterized protein (TIGR00299 family) protein